MNMNEKFFRDRAKTIRNLAEKADPHTKRRLLDLASRYEKKPRTPAPIPSPVNDKSLTNAVGLVEEILAIPRGSLGLLVDSKSDCLGKQTSPAFTDRLLSEIVQRR